MTTALFSSNTVMPFTLVCSTLTWEILVCFSSLPERIWALSSHISRKWPQQERGARATSQLRHFSGTTETGVYLFKKGKGVEPRTPHVLHNYINHWNTDTRKATSMAPFSHRRGSGSGGRRRMLGHPAKAPNPDPRTEHQHLHRVQESAPDNEAQHLHKCPRNSEALALSNVRYLGDLGWAGALVRHRGSCRPRSCAAPHVSQCAQANSILPWVDVVNRGTVSASNSGFMLSTHSQKRT